MNGGFEVVGIRPLPPGTPVKRGKWYRGKPLAAIVILTMIFLGCLFYPLTMAKDPAYMDLQNCNIAPCAAFWFGTDAMGRDIFSMIWYGGRLSLFIGLASTILSTAIAIIFGAVSGCAPGWLDALLMRMTEIVLSVPGLLLTVLLQSVLGRASAVSLAFVIGATSWAGMAKVVRTEVRQLHASEYILAARSMGGGFFHILWRHLTPNFVSSLMFMSVMNVQSAIAAESTMSFMGIGLPPEAVTWGSMLSLSENALLTGAWWVVLIPGVFLTATLLCITSLGNCLRRSVERRESCL